jgi:ABC-type Fe3+-hydroxamate transport system substrate-binding protein
MTRRIAVALAALTLFLNQAFAVTVNDSRGPHEIATPPERVVALDWPIAEQLLELGVSPIAVTDVDGYNTWVMRPALPAGTESVGLRHEPNVERILELKPDLIVISDEQIDFADTLERIAPVLHFDSFSIDHDNAAQARKVYLELSKVFGKEEPAKARLADLDARLDAMKQSIHDHFGGQFPKVVITRLLDTTHVRVYGGNSMAEAALTALGIEPAFPQPRSEWGFVLKRVEDLGAIKGGVVLDIGPFPAADELFPTPLWKAMPFVRADRFASVRPSWTYGGAFSVGHLAESFTEALLKLDH